MPIWANLFNTENSITFGIQRKLINTSKFDYIYYTKQTWSKFGFWLYLLIWANVCNTNNLITFATTEETCSILRNRQQLSAYANFINTASLITFAGPSKHFKSTLLSTFATFCKLPGNNKFACFHMGSKCCAKKQIRSIICLICKKASKKTICIRICFMGNCIENS